MPGCIPGNASSPTTSSSSKQSSEKTMNDKDRLFWAAIFFHCVWVYKGAHLSEFDTAIEVAKYFLEKLNAEDAKK